MNYPVPEKYLSHWAPNYISVPEYRHNLVLKVDPRQINAEEMVKSLLRAYMGLSELGQAMQQQPLPTTSRMRTPEEQQALRERAAPNLLDNQKYIIMHMPIINETTKITIPTLPKKELTFTFFPSIAHKKPSFALFRPLFARIKRFFQNLI